jgi:hypothetical protein
MKSLRPLFVTTSLLLMILAMLVQSCGGDGNSASVAPTPTPSSTTDPNDLPQVVSINVPSTVVRGQTLVVSASVSTPAGLSGTTPIVATIVGPAIDESVSLTLSDISCIAGATFCTPIGSADIPTNQRLGTYEITVTVFDQQGRSASNSILVEITAS